MCRPERTYGMCRPDGVNGGSAALPGARMGSPVELGQWLASLSARPMGVAQPGLGLQGPGGWR